MTNPNGSERDPDDAQQEPEDLGGERAGEFDLAPTQPFFVSKKAAAVLKHGILSSYVPPWASKVGSTSVGKRVVYLDGYAGPGRYEDGTEGSPTLILRTARSMTYRNVECLFVERKRADYKKLESIVTEARADGVHCEAYKGRLEKHLSDLIDHTGDAPLFAFLDPFGLAIPFDDITHKIMGGQRDASTGRKTEVLINFSANAVRRIGGFLDPDCQASNREATLDAMDRACGGRWWRDEFNAHATSEERVAAIAGRFMRNAAEACGSGGWVFPVRNRATLQPVYALVYLSRHSDGMWLFGEALSSAQEKWRRHLAPPPQNTEGTLFNLGDLFEEEERERKDDWVRQIKVNIADLLRTNDNFTVLDRSDQIYGSTLGLARSLHVRQAIKQLHAEGVTSCDGRGQIDRLRITRSPSRPDHHV